jgi:hypothetical protein
LQILQVLNRIQADGVNKQRRIPRLTTDFIGLSWSRVERQLLSGNPGHLAGLFDEVDKRFGGLRFCIVGCGGIGLIRAAGRRGNEGMVDRVCVLIYRKIKKRIMQKMHSPFCFSMGSCSFLAFYLPKVAARKEDYLIREMGVYASHKPAIHPNHLTVDPTTI